MWFWELGTDTSPRAWERGRDMAQGSGQREGFDCGHWGTKKPSCLWTWVEGGLWLWEVKGQRWTLYMQIKNHLILWISFHSLPVSKRWGYFIEMAISQSFTEAETTWRSSDVRQNNTEDINSAEQSTREGDGKEQGCWSKVSLAPIWEHNCSLKPSLHCKNRHVQWNCFSRYTWQAPVTVISHTVQLKGRQSFAPIQLLTDQPVKSFVTSSWTPQQVSSGGREAVTAKGIRRHLSPSCPPTPSAGRNQPSSSLCPWARRKAGEQCLHFPPDTLLQQHGPQLSLQAQYFPPNIHTHNDFTVLFLCTPWDKRAQLFKCLHEQSIPQCSEGKTCSEQGDNLSLYTDEHKPLVWWANDKAGNFKTSNTNSSASRPQERTLLPPGGKQSIFKGNLRQWRRNSAQHLIHQH